MKQLTIIAFALAVAGVITGDLFHLTVLHAITKPIILISLITHYYFSVGSENRSTLLILALVFSLLGDVLLLKEEYFIPGLVAFLTAHIVYIFAYRQHQSGTTENTLQGIHRIRLAFPIILAGTGLVIVLYPHLGALQFPVMIYALVITLMTLTALIRYGRTTVVSFWMVFSGAVCFMISDSILALNKFLSPIAFSGVYIMLTYSIAQLLIVKGLMKHVESFKN